MPLLSVRICESCLTLVTDNIGGQVCRQESMTIEDNIDTNDNVYGYWKIQSRKLSIIRVNLVLP